MIVRNTLIVLLRQLIKVNLISLKNFEENIQKIKRIYIIHVNALTIMSEMVYFVKKLILVKQALTIAGNMLCVFQIRVTEDTGCFLRFS